MHIVNFLYILNSKAKEFEEYGQYGEKFSEIIHRIYMYRAEAFAFFLLFFILHWVYKITSVQQVIHLTSYIFVQASSNITFT